MKKEKRKEAKRTLDSERSFRKMETAMKAETKSLAQTGNGKESDGKREESGHLFTQSEVDRLIGERLKRERSLNAGLSEMKEVITQLQSCGILNATSRAGAASELAGRLQAMLAGNGKQAAAETDAENAGGIRDGAPETEAEAKNGSAVFCAEKTGALSEKSEESEKSEASDKSDEPEEREVGTGALSRDTEEKTDAEDGGKKTDAGSCGGFFDDKSRAGADGLFAVSPSGTSGASEASADTEAAPFGLRREELCGLYAEKAEEAAEPDGDDNDVLLPDAEGLRALLLSAARGKAASERGSEETLNGALKEIQDEASEKIPDEIPEEIPEEISEEISEEIPREFPEETGGEGAYPGAFVHGEKSAPSAKGAEDELSEFCEQFPDADPGKLLCDKGFRSFAGREAEKGKRLAALYGEYSELLQSIAALRTGTSEADAGGTDDSRDGGRHSGLFSTGFSGKGASASAYMADSLTASQREIARLAGLSLREYAEMLRDIPTKEVMGRER